MNHIALMMDPRSLEELISSTFVRISIERRPKMPVVNKMKMATGTAPLVLPE
jgi:hypothetical protein